MTGLEQTLHFKQVFKAIEIMGHDWAKDLIHIPYGLVSLAGAKLSTRNGNIIYAEDILKEAIERANISIRKKNPELKDKETVAKMVGVGAIIFHDLFNQRTEPLPAKAGRFGGLLKQPKDARVTFSQYRLLLSYFKIGQAASFL